jgi:cytidyltransferase-like protein
MTSKNMRAAVIGGSGGLGLAIASEMCRRGWSVDVYDRAEPAALPPNARFVRFNLLSDDIAAIDVNVDALVFTAGFGRVARFGELEDYEIMNGFRVNAEMPARVLSRFMPCMTDGDFYAAFIGSVAGRIPSPMFAAYGAQKSALRALVENVNAELRYDGRKNRVLLVEPGTIKGTGFYGGATDIGALRPLAEEIISRMLERETAYIPDADTYGPVIRRAQADPAEFARSSMEYKLNSGRMSDRPSGVKGFLSGTFDLFHVGHLNLLMRAKQYCDYLTVGVHPAGSSHKNKPVFVPLEERMRIVAAVKYVDRVVVTLDEDDDMYFQEPFDMLFVGSDYKGTPRFERYEKKLTPLGVRIIYFPYTQGTSSTQLRDAISRE